MIADALELGALRIESIRLTDEQEQWLAEVTPKSVPLNVTRTLLEYYIANKPTDSNWCVLPVTNVEAYLGSSALNRMYLKWLPETALERKQMDAGVCIYKMTVATTVTTICH